MSPGAIRECFKFSSRRSFCLQMISSASPQPFDILEFTVAESKEDSESEGVPGDGGNLVEPVGLHLIGLFLRESNSINISSHQNRINPIIHGPHSPKDPLCSLSASFFYSKMLILSP